MSIFDVLTNGSLGSVIENITRQAGIGSSGMGSVLDSLGGKAKDFANNMRQNTPGGLGGLAGAGALGALLGNVFSGDIMKSVALAGAGAVAYNFYKKWAAKQMQTDNGGQAAPAGADDMPPGWGASSTVPATGPDPTAELVMRAMIYAARADGNIDKAEQERIDSVLQTMLPGQDVSGAVQRIKTEMIDPNKIAASVGSPEQAEDVYRLSCAVIDIDHFMEHSYTQALAQALGISESKKKQLENEADQARRQLMSMAKA